MAGVDVMSLSLRTQEPHCRRDCTDTYRPQPPWVKSSITEDSVQISQCTILVIPQGVGRLDVEKIVSENVCAVWPEGVLCFSCHWGAYDRRY